MGRIIEPTRRQALAVARPPLALHFSTASNSACSPGKRASIPSAPFAWYANRW